MRSKTQRALQQMVGGVGEAVTILIETITKIQQNRKGQRPSHQEHHFLLFLNSEWDPSDTEPIIYRPNPRRLQSLTICRCQ